MKLSSRLILIVVAVVLGLGAVSGFAVYKIRETMLEERQAGMSILLQLAASQANADDEYRVALIRVPVREGASPGEVASARERAQYS